ncbi:hypothetical protein HZS_1312 [Henneguya salminicola]|nr:hypothetical protein HZS_1312 [Henneguya salminicola]
MVKYHREHRVNEAWIFGEVERIPEGRLFLIKVPDRTVDSLTRITQTHVLPNPIIPTDYFRSYLNLNLLNRINSLDEDGNIMVPLFDDFLEEFQ